MAEAKSRYGQQIWDHQLFTPMKWLPCGVIPYIIDEFSIIDSKDLATVFDFINYKQAQDPDYCE